MKGFDKTGFEKYILGLMLMLCLAGSGDAQTVQQNRRRQKTENVEPDTVRPKTITHTNPFQQVRPPHIPQDSPIKFSLKESTNFNVQGFMNATKDNVYLVGGLFGHACPFVRINNNVDIGLAATGVVWNYINPKTFSPSVLDMYAHAKWRSGLGDFTAFAGKKSLLNYAGEVSKNMSVKNFFMNAVHFKSGHFYERVVGAGFTNKIGAVQIGYAEENTPGFKFTGNGAFVLAAEAFIEDSWKGGILVTIGPEKTIIDMQMIWRPNDRHVFMAEIADMDLCEHANLHALYDYTCDGGNVAFFIDGCTQLGKVDNPIQSISGGIRLPKLGVNAMGGCARYDPMNKTNADGTPNVEYQDGTWMPFAVFEVTFGLQPGK